MRSSWVNDCQYLYTSAKLIEKQKVISRKQRQRAKLQGERYEIAKTSMFEVIQAEDDAAAAAFQEYVYLAEAHQTAWRLKQIKGDLLSQLKEKMGLKGDVKNKGNVSQHKNLKAEEKN